MRRGMEEERTIQFTFSPHFSPPEDGFSNPSGHSGLENPPSDTAQPVTIGEKCGLGTSFITSEHDESSRVAAGVKLGKPANSD